MTQSVARRLDAMDDAAARVALTRCCGAARWVAGMLERRPFGRDAAVLQAADAVWATMDEADRLEAFSHHPEIGADIDALRRKFRGGDLAWSSGEQSGVAAADEDVLVRLRDANVRYRQRFGFIFIVCATGKSAAQMLALLEAREGNDRAAELDIAAAEQAKITRLRLEKLAMESASDPASESANESANESADEPVTTGQ